MTLWLIKLGHFNCPSAWSYCWNGMLNVIWPLITWVTDHSAIRIPFSGITGHHPQSASGPIEQGGLTAVSIFYSSSWPDRQVCWTAKWICETAYIVSWWGPELFCTFSYCSVSKIRICKIFIFREILKHWRLSIVQVQNVY